MNTLFFPELFFALRAWSLAKGMPSYAAMSLCPIVEAEDRRVLIDQIQERPTALLRGAWGVDLSDGVWSFGEHLCPLSWACALRYRHRSVADLVRVRGGVSVEMHDLVAQALGLDVRSVFGFVTVVDHDHKNKKPDDPKGIEYFLSELGARAARRAGVVFGQETAQALGRLAASRELPVTDVTLVEGAYWGARLLTGIRVDWKEPPKWDC